MLINQKTEHEKQLEQLLNKAGLPFIVSALAQLCYANADLCRDIHYFRKSKIWEAAAGLLDSIAENPKIAEL